MPYPKAPSQANSVYVYKPEGNIPLEYFEFWDCFKHRLPELLRGQGSPLLVIAKCEAQFSVDCRPLKTAGIKHRRLRESWELHGLRSEIVFTCEDWLNSEIGKDSAFLAMLSAGRIKLVPITWLTDFLEKEAWR